MEIASNLKKQCFITNIKIHCMPQQRLYYLCCLQIKLVCANLRSQGVNGHMGVFGIHYEADNSRLYVVCAKHVTEPQLYNEFTVFGPAQVKLNFDANGLSKVILLKGFYS